jgi:hypothetical protein
VFTAEVVEHGQFESCDLKKGYRDFMKVITVADSLLTLFIPSILIIGMNSVIVRNLMEFRQQLRMDMSAEDSSEPSNSGIPMVSDLPCAIQRIKLPIIIFFFAISLLIAPSLTKLVSGLILFIFNMMHLKHTDAVV